MQAKKKKTTTKTAAATTATTPAMCSLQSAVAPLLRLRLHTPQHVNGPAVAAAASASAAVAASDCNATSSTPTLKIVNEMTAEV